LNAIGLVRWKFGHDSGFNPKYWGDAVGMVRANPAAGVNDMFGANVSMYTRGCKITSRIILLKGVLDTIGEKAFSDAIGTGGDITPKAFGAHLLMQDDTGHIHRKGMPPKDWVPGDVGYVQGKNPDRELTGEWIVYKGSSIWWGFGFGGNGQTLDKWISDVKGWRGADPNFEPYVGGRRIYPGVGLQ
jgi:hypothetical protein